MSDVDRNRKWKWIKVLFRCSRKHLILPNKMTIISRIYITIKTLNQLIVSMYQRVLDHAERVGHSRWIGWIYDAVVLNQQLTDQTDRHLVMIEHSHESCPVSHVYPNCLNNHFIVSNIWGQHLLTASLTKVLAIKSSFVMLVDIKGHKSFNYMQKLIKTENG